MVKVVPGITLIICPFHLNPILCLTFSWRYMLETHLELHTSPWEAYSNLSNIIKDDYLPITKFLDTNNTKRN